MNALAANKLARIEMWCARSWFDAKEAAVRELVKGNVSEHTRHMQDAEDWFAALLIVNRLVIEMENRR